MALGKSLPFSKFLVLVGDGADPEVFAAPCGLTSRGFQQTATVQETTTPDCDNEELAVDVERQVDTKSRTISGSGVIAMQSLPLYQQWFDGGLPKNVRVKMDETLANNGGFWSGKFVLTTFNLSGDRAQKVNVEIELQSDGAVVWTPAAA